MRGLQASCPHSTPAKTGTKNKPTRSSCFETCTKVWIIAWYYPEGLYVRMHMSESVVDSRCYGLTLPLCVFRLIEELTTELRSKEAVITELSGEKTTLTLRVGELEGQVHELSSSLLQKDKDVEVYKLLQWKLTSKGVFKLQNVNKLLSFYELSSCMWSMTGKAFKMYPAPLFFLHSSGPPCFFWYGFYSRKRLLKQQMWHSSALFEQLFMWVIRAVYTPKPLRK